ncbi:hypothetical protein NFI96_022047 [Prochilodus magdalenae]|nr:hypothetical protein NFI96_022047 [Prochilodus magdalenae]
MNVDVEDDIEQTVQDGVAVDNPPKETEKGHDEEGQEGVNSSQVNSEVESPPKAIKKEEDGMQPILTDEREGNLQQEGQGDGAGGDRLDGEGEDLETNETPEKGKDEEGQKEVTHPVESFISSQEVNNKTEEDTMHPILTDERVGNLQQQGQGDVIRDKDTERRSLVKKEEHERSIEECTGEGDAAPHDKKETRLPLVKTQDTHYTQFIYISAAIFAVVAVLVLWYLRSEPPPVQQELDPVEVFYHEMDKVESSFPSQHKELWRRSRIHLRRHLQVNQHSEPVSLILTSGRGAKKTLGCLAQQIAAAFSMAQNGSILDIDGTNITVQDSDDVKLDIDRKLKEAFDGGKKAAVIHRFEELPPGSTLIFYRYCDHENAAYKNVFLAFTVLLQEEMELPPNVSLGMVEEMVQEYLKDKFVSPHRTAVFNQMDVDKLSGLWSRISHLILPVAAEQKIEQDGCGGSG